ncbi:hypothetical protein EKO04_007656 [Ascochyta lentis]|uniref:Uncharacterized protein n=1 Tax=Ascochyta lentis TaxID=205686 RepID=A0A8H7MIE1_9PLEO|nr:hypothetical protein EKO04_007656 [Ascochyta lentis]
MARNFQRNDVEANVTECAIATCFPAAERHTRRRRTRTWTMGKKKRSGQAELNGEASAATSTSTSALIICRNKHWRYISSFHGPWLQLPAEVLESLAHSNFVSPRPRAMDAAVLYDLVKIRRHVDEASQLAVRATSGLTAAALNSSLHNHGLHNQHMLGQAAALGMGVGVGVGAGMGYAGGGKLSRERKHRMRELATAKLSAAYHLDEIAASVATMQSASTLEDVAQLVLQRNPTDVDARYVHFFHEKIPSRMMAQSTPLDALDDIVAERPTDGSALRTRALTRIFKDDYVNAAKDLTAALATHQQQQHQQHQQHHQQQQQHHPQHHHHHHHNRDWRSDVKLADHDQPSSLETQLLFHRAGVYFTIACTHVHAALDGLGEHDGLSEHDDAPLLRAESRKQVRQNAKRALRDYLAFLAHFDYTPGIAPDVADDFLRRLQHTNGHAPALLDTPSPSASPASDALTPYRKPAPNPSVPSDRSTWPKLPPPPVFKTSQLFDAVPPPSLPPYPPTSPPNPATSAFAAHESLTYHPLLTDALHSLLLCHALLQTPPKEHLRHAHNAARLVRISDGYPIFLAARSPARSDWVEVLRRGGNWIGLTRSWDKLCRPTQPDTAPKSSTTSRAPEPSTDESPTQRRERQKHEAILDALADERVVDEATFQRAVRAREQRFRDDEIADALPSTSTPPLNSAAPSRSNGNSTTSTSKSNSNSNSNSNASTSGSTSTSTGTSTNTNHPISTPRAESILRWLRDAPPLTADNPSPAKTNKRRRRKAVAASVTTSTPVTNTTATTTATAAATTATAAATTATATHSATTATTAGRGTAGGTAGEPAGEVVGGTAAPAPAPAPAPEKNKQQSTALEEGVDALSVGVDHSLGHGLGE